MSHSQPSPSPSRPLCRPNLANRVYARGGAALQSVFDVFLHAAQVQQASAASLVSGQSDLTHGDSAVAQNLTSQLRKSEHLGKGNGPTPVLHSA